MAPKIQNSPDDAYRKLKDRIYFRLKEDKIEDQIFEAVKDKFEKSLKSEHIVLSRMEKNRLLHEILKSVLKDILDRI